MGIIIITITILFCHCHRLIFVITTNNNHISCSLQNCSCVYSCLKRQFHYYLSESVCYILFHFFCQLQSYELNHYITYALFPYEMHHDCKLWFPLAPVYVMSSDLCVSFVDFAILGHLKYSYHHKINRSSTTLHMQFETRNS